MRINENLLINNDKLTIPGYEKEKSTVSFKDGRIYFEELNSFMANMTISGSAENLSKEIDPTATYYVGIYGKTDKTLKIYKGDTYKTAKTIGDFHYIEIQGDKIKSATYVLSNEGAKGYIYGLGVYKDYPSDIYIPNINSLDDEDKDIYPPEGEYKEIQAI